MSWFCNTPEAAEQMKICEANKCPGCDKCIWIEESAWAMTEHGKVIEPEIEPEIEPDTKNEIIQPKIHTQTVNKPTKTFNSFEEKVEYIIKKFGGKKID